MSIYFSASPLPMPEDMPLKARLAWDYFKFNDGGWLVAETSDGAVIATDEGGNISESGFVCPDLDSFVDYLEEVADDHIKDGNTNFLSPWIKPELLNTEVAEAAFKILAAAAETPPDITYQVKQPPYTLLRKYEDMGHRTVRVVEIATGRTGVARSDISRVDFGVKVTYDDAVSEDPADIVSADYFNRRFFISAVIIEDSNPDKASE